MVKKRIDSQATDKTQTVKQQPLKALKGIPSKVNIANLNPNSYILDETNGILHVKGNNKTFKFQGIAE